MLYRKKPILVEAHQWFPTPQEAGKPRKPEFHGVRYCPPTRVDLTATRGIIVDRAESYVIDTLEGVMTVAPGDWIVKGIIGERYPVKPDIFALTYEPAKAAHVRSHLAWSLLFSRWFKNDHQISRKD